MSIVRYGLLALVGIALLSVWGASAAGNFAHGVQLAGHSPYWWVFGLASASMDVLKASSLLALVPAYRIRWWGAVVACLLVWAVTTAWGVRSCAGFIATTLSDTASGRNMHSVADGSLKKQIDDQVAQITKLQDLKMKAPARDWDRIEAEIGRVDSYLEKLRKRARDTQTVGDSDPTSKLLERWVDKDNTNMGTVLLFLLGIEICASLGLVAFRPFYGSRATEVENHLTRAASDAREATTPPHKGEGKLKLVPASPLRVQALELLAQLEVKRGMGSAVWTADVWTVYLALAKERQWQPMASRKLGQQLALLGVTKTDADSQKRKYYVLPTAREKAARKRGREEGLPVA